VRRGLYVLVFALGFASAGTFSAVVVAETLPTTTTTAPTSTATTTTTTGATTTTPPTTTTTPPTTTTTPPTTTTATTTVTTTTTTVPTTTSRTTTTTTTTPPRPRPKTVPARVRIATVDVGRLDSAAATAAVRAAFAARLPVIVDKTRFDLRPDRLAKAYITGAVSRARTSSPGARVKLVVAVRGAAVRAVTARLAKRFERPAVDAELTFRNARPYVSRERVGRDLNGAVITRAIVRALTRTSRAPLRFETTVVAPRVTRRSVGPVIVINRLLNRLSLYQGMSPWRTFGVATGQSSYPTPRGWFHIVVKARNPWWYPPTSSDWARGLEPVPPGPGNPLGTRWMGISSPGVGIHGTPDAASIGYSASHGCIRMRIPDAEWMFEHVGIGTTVYIV
jgi:lipoprotein-anchoring transpeptidase ErfK/SrfK